MTLSPASSRGGGGLFDAYAYYREEQAQDTDAGTFTSGAWRTRVLNTEVFDTDAIGALAANQITLGAGTYFVYATAPAYKVDFHQLRFQNVTDAATVGVGSSSFGSNALVGDGYAVLATLSCRFTIAAAKAFELQHQCATTFANQGLGIAANFTTEVYAQVWIYREGA